MSEKKIVKPDISHDFKPPRDFRDIAEICQRFFRGHVQDIGNVLSFKIDFESLAVVSEAVANGAGDEHIRKEVHLDPLPAVALAGLATAAFNVVAEPAVFISSRSGFRQHCEKISNVVEQTDIGGGGRARSFAYRRSVH